MAVHVKQGIGSAMSVRAHMTLMPLKRSTHTLAAGQQSSHTECRPRCDAAVGELRDLLIDLRPFLSSATTPATLGNEGADDARARCSAPRQ